MNGAKYLKNYRRYFSRLLSVICFLGHLLHIWPVAHSPQKTNKYFFDLCTAYIFEYQKMHSFALFIQFFSLFNVYNNLFWIDVRGICIVYTSDKYFLFNWSTVCVKSIYNHIRLLGRFAPIFHFNCEHVLSVYIVKQKQDKNCWPDRFSRFDVYLIQTNKHTDAQTDKQSLYR